MDHLCQKICSQELSNIAQSGHTAHNSPSHTHTHVHAHDATEWEDRDCEEETHFPGLGDASDKNTRLLRTGYFVGMKSSRVGIEGPRLLGANDDDDRRRTKLSVEVLTSTKKRFGGNFQFVHPTTTSHPTSSLSPTR